MLNYRDPKATKVTMKGDWVYRGGRRLGYVHHQGFGRSAGSKSWRFGVTPTGNPRSSAWSSTHPGSIRSPRRSPHACPHGPASPSSAKSSPAGEPGRGATKPPTTTEGAPPMTLPPDLAYTMGGPFTPEQVELLTMPTTREREAQWAHQFRELSDADRLHQLGFEDLDDLDAAGEDIPEECERATVTYPTGRQLTAMWPVGQIEKEMAKYPGASARIH